MENIDLQSIPPGQIHGMGRITLEAAEQFFADPEVQKRYKAWLKEKKSQKVHENPA